MTALLTRLESLLTPNADGLLPCQQHSDASLSDLSIEDGHDGQTFAIVCWCGVRGPDSMTRDGAVAAWNSRPILRALVEAIRQRDELVEELEGNQLALDHGKRNADSALLAILEGKP